MSFKNPDKLKKKKPAMKYEVKPAEKGDKDTGTRPINKNSVSKKPTKIKK